MISDLYLRLYNGHFERVSFANICHTYSRYKIQNLLAAPKAIRMKNDMNE